MQCVPSTYHNCLKVIHEGIVHCVLGDENPYSHCNTTHLPNDTALPSTHFFTPMPKNEELVDDPYKNGNISNMLKDKHILDQSKPSKDNQGENSGLKSKLIATPQEKKYWEERAKKLDEMNKASSSKSSSKVNVLSKTNKDKS